MIWRKVLLSLLCVLFFPLVPFSLLSMVCLEYELKHHLRVKVKKDRYLKAKLLIVDETVTLNEYDAKVIQMTKNMTYKAKRVLVCNLLKSLRGHIND